jgi:hypothetical protein
MEVLRQAAPSVASILGVQGNPMHLMIFVTEDENGASTGPIVYLPERADAALPPHPRALEWRYFATVLESDTLLGGDRVPILSGIEENGHFIAQRMI